MSVFGDMGRATRKGFNRMIEARQREATRYVNGALLQLDDETLARAGIDRKALRRRSSTVFPF